MAVRLGVSLSGWLLCVGICTANAQAMGLRQDTLFFKKPLNFLLCQYCDSGNVEVVEQLLEHGASPDAADEYGVTPLMYAVQSGSYQLVELLLARNANPNKKPFNGNTALHATLRAGNDSIAELLLRSKADANIQNYLGLTPLHYSAWYGMPYMTDLLLFHGARVDAVDNERNTPLMLSAYNGALLSARILLENDASPNSVNEAGVSPLMVAAQFNDTALMGLLYDYGADVSLVDKAGANALAYAIGSNSTDAVDFLVALGAADSSVGRPYYQLAAETDFPNLKARLDSLGLKVRLRPSLGGITLGTGTHLNRHEFLWGGSLGLTEYVSKLNISLGYWFRPNPVATLERRDFELYQFREKRSILELRAARQTTLLYRGHTYMGVYYGGSVGAIFRSYRGAKNAPKTSVHPGFGAGIFWGSKAVRVLVGWEFTSLKTPDASQHRLGISLSFFIPFKSYLPRAYISYVD